MLYETLSQPLIVLYLFLGGFICGIFFDFANMILVGSKREKISYKIFRNILDCICVFLAFVIFYIIVLQTAYGEVRFYQIIIFALAVILERITIGKFVAKLLNWCYNKLKIFLTYAFNKIKNLKILKKLKKDYQEE